jgi:hypothetical protein
MPSCPDCLCTTAACPQGSVATLSTCGSVALGTLQSTFAGHHTFLAWQRSHSISSSSGGGRNYSSWRWHRVSRQCCTTAAKECQGSIGWWPRCPTQYNVPGAVQPVPSAVHRKYSLIYWALPASSWVHGATRSRVWGTSLPEQELRQQPGFPGCGGEQWACEAHRGPAAWACSQPGVCQVSSSWARELRMVGRVWATWVTKQGAAAR